MAGLAKFAKSRPIGRSIPCRCVRGGYLLAGEAAAAVRCARLRLALRHGDRRTSTVYAKAGGVAAVPEHHRCFPAQLVVDDHAGGAAACPTNAASLDGLALGRHRVTMVPTAPIRLGAASAPVTGRSPKTKPKQTCHDESHACGLRLLRPQPLR